MSEFKASTRPSGVWASDPIPTLAPAPEPTSPAGLTIPGSGRAEPSDAPFQAPAPRPQLPGRRGFGGTVEMIDGQAVFTDHSLQSPAVYVPAQAPGPKTSSTAPLVFMKQGTNTRVLAKDVGTADLVDLGGQIGVTTVGGALHNGWLVETANGFERAGEAAPPKPASRTAKDTGEAGGQGQAGHDKSDATNQEAAPVDREYLSQADEAALVEIERQVGPQVFANVERALVSAEATEIPESIITSVAAKLGVDRDGALAAIAQHAQPYITQATQTIAAAVGEAGAAEALEWARQHAKHELADAMRRQIDSRDLDGYRTIGKMWLMAEARRDPHRVAAGLVAAGTRARVAGKEVIVDLGKAGGGETSFAAALRGDVVQLGKSRRGPGRRS